MTKLEKVQEAKAEVVAKLDAKIAKITKANAEKEAKVKAKEAKKASKKKVVVKKNIKSF